MIEAYAIIATLAAGSGWLLYWEKARKASYWKRDALSERTLVDYLCKRLQDAKAATDRQADCIGGLQSRLQEIADQETPSANATVKRMAAIARREA